MKQTAAYNDFWIRVIGSLLCVHFIEVLGRDESFFQLLLQRFYYVDVFTGFIIAFITWEYTYRVTCWLDLRYDWMTKPIQRVALQLLLGVVVGSLLIFFLTYLQFRFILHNPEDFFFNEWLFTYYPVSILLVLLTNGYYFTRYLYNQWKETKGQLAARKEKESNDVASGGSPASSKGSPRDVIIVTQGAKNLPVKMDDVAYFYIWQQYTYIRLLNGENYISNNSLDEIYSWLDKEKFYRANRQVIIHIKCCQSYSAIENGKIEIHAQPSHKEPIIVSQKKAREFKDWLGRPVSG